MKTVVMVMVALAACVAAESSAKPAPAHENARVQLPEQASDNAQPPSKELALPPLPEPSPLIPPVILTFTAGQPASQSEAVRAINSATQTTRIAVRSSSTVSVITMTATRLGLRKTALSPRGRAGDLESTRWRFNDRYGRRIGTGNLLCRWATFSRRLCWGEARLPRGRLVMLGSSQTRSLGEFSVVGGTGVYLGKQGVLTFSILSRNKWAVRVLLV